MGSPLSEVIEAIKRGKRFLITAHVNLEGDALGSQLAMKELLVGMGKDAFILDSDPVPEHYRFLPKASEVSNDLNNINDFDAAVVLDCPTLNRTGKIKDVIKDRAKPIINIDHHISNEKFGDVNWVEPNASSAGEMVFRLFKETGTVMTKEIALSLYIAILTDTGSFNYDNTSSATHEIAGELLGYGLDPALVSESVYERRSIEDINLLGLVLSTIRINSGGTIAHLEVTKDMLDKTGADIAKSEGIINFARSIDGVKVAVLFKEDQKDKNRINISFRSKGNGDVIDVNKIASFFGGGGHTKASGCIMMGGIKEVKKKVLEKIEEAF
ncbi:MAG: bifunctional oligoribonuclease/PAP phosphatase NrnA [Candidatus Omnitrophota bacterium]|nr:bifunctional oligoribonuclease/PAP phosphatase NrnA [Candidatus Omnitrophota bacterium]